MAEQQADIDSLLDDVPLEGEEDAKPTSAVTTTDKTDDAKKDDKDESAESAISAKEVDKHLKAALKEHLPKPGLAVAMVDILSPGTALVRLDWFKNITPMQHLLLAFAGIVMAAIATNPEVIQKMRDGLGRKNGNPRDRVKGQKPAKQANPKTAQPVPATPADTPSSPPPLPTSPVQEPTA